MSEMEPPSKEQDDAPIPARAGGREDLMCPRRRIVDNVWPGREYLWYSIRGAFVRTNGMWYGCIIAVRNNIYECARELGKLILPII